jgi:DNA-binding XRE family transcriptional regulator
MRHTLSGAIATQNIAQQLQSNFHLKEGMWVATNDQNVSEIHIPYYSTLIEVIGWIGAEWIGDRAIFSDDSFIDFQDFKTGIHSGGSDNTFPAWLKVQIKELGQGNKEFAERIGVSRPTLFRWLKGRDIPNRNSINKIALEVAAFRVVDGPSVRDEIEECLSQRKSPNG